MTEEATTMKETANSVPQRERDLVMKGGITSGVVYPTAIRTIAEQYSFRNLGGASAGAIGAVAAAACEFRRNSGDKDAFLALETVGGKIGQEGFVQNLFHPRPNAEAAFQVALGAAADRRGRTSQPQLPNSARHGAVLASGRPRRRARAAHDVSRRNLQQLSNPLF
jgi:hypothetical protein